MPVLRFPNQILLITFFNIFLELHLIKGNAIVSEEIGNKPCKSSILLNCKQAPQDWKEQLGKTTGGFLKGLANGIAREANREVDTGKPLNPVAIAASGALSAVPGTAATKLPLGLAGRIGAGLATGYASDIANRGVQQLGDTGRVI